MLRQRPLGAHRARPGRPKNQQMGPKYNETDACAFFKTVAYYQREEMATDNEIIYDIWRCIHILCNLRVNN